jgi:hypothetical protein
LAPLQPLRSGSTLSLRMRPAGAGNDREPPPGGAPQAVGVSKLEGQSARKARALLAT